MILSDGDNDWTLGCLRRHHSLHHWLSCHHHGRGCHHHWRRSHHHWRRSHHHGRRSHHHGHALGRYRLHRHIYLVSSQLLVLNLLQFGILPLLPPAVDDGNCSNDKYHATNGASNSSTGVRSCAIINSTIIVLLVRRAILSVGVRVVQRSFYA